MWSRSQIITNVVEYIKTGIPENIKSFNVRPLLKEMAQNIIGGRENITNNKRYILKSIEDPDNEGEIMVVFEEMTTSRQIVLVDDYDSLPSNLVVTLPDLFFYTKDKKKIYFRNPDLSYDSLGYASAAEWKTVEPGQVYNFPLAKKGERFAFRIYDGSTYQPDSSFWLGGIAGISAGHHTIIEAMQNSPGGNFATAGNHFLIINQKKITTLQPYPTDEDFPAIGEYGVIYLDESDGSTYYWGDGEYEELGEAIYGTLQNSTTFINDADDQPVEPDGTKVYIDTDTNKTYRWNGAVFVQLDQAEVTPVPKTKTFTYAKYGDNEVLLYDMKQRIYSIWIDAGNYWKKGNGSTPAANESFTVDDNPGVFGVKVTVNADLLIEGQEFTIFYI